jgi:hypothetical protein
MSAAPPYRPHPPRSLVPGPQSGKRHSDRRVSTWQNARCHHPVRPPSVQIKNGPWRKSLMLMDSRCRCGTSRPISGIASEFGRDH